MTSAQTTLSIAGIGVTLRAAPALVATLRARWRPFVVDTSSRTFMVRAATALAPVGDHAAVTRGRGGLRIACSDRFRIDVPAGRAPGLVRFNPAAGGPEIDGLAETLVGALRNLYAVLIAQHGGLLLHASAVTTPRGAVLFAGPSGTGKSTCCRMFPAALRLGDDLTAVIPDGRGFVAYGTPLDRGSSRSARVARAHPLRLLATIQQGTALAARPLAPADAVAALLRNTLMPDGDPQLARQCLASAVRLACAAPICSFTTTLDGRRLRTLTAQVARAGHA